MLMKPLVRRNEDATLCQSSFFIVIHLSTSRCTLAAQNEDMGRPGHGDGLFDCSTGNSEMLRAEVLLASSKDLSSSPLAAQFLELEFRESE